MPDSTITLNTSICNLSRSSINPTKYDLQAVTSHEIDEVLGFGSALNGSSNGPQPPQGRYRWTICGVMTRMASGPSIPPLPIKRTFPSMAATRDLARFNQQAGGDFSDWYSPGGQTPQVQDAFNTPGATPNLGVELIRLNVDGYTPAPLATPTGLTATPVSSSQINLSWNSEPGATSYTLEESTNGSTWNVLATTNGTTYSDTGLQAGTTYYFRVLASNRLGSSAYSAPVSAATLAGVPPTPSGLMATTVSTSQINLNWNSVVGRASTRWSGAWMI